jgi:hypothetical protein
MVRRILITLLAVGLLIALLPPLFTHGACTAEFDSVTDAYQHLRAEFATVQKAQAWLQAQTLRYQLLTPQRCLIWPAREVVQCPGGPVLLVALPVKDRVCHYYRDRQIRLQLGFNSAQQLVRIQTDMNPYQMLKLPWLNFELDWAR